MYSHAVETSNSRWSDHAISKKDNIVFFKEYEEKQAKLSLLDSLVQNNTQMLNQIYNSNSPIDRQIEIQQQIAEILMQDLVRMNGISKSQKDMMQGIAIPGILSSGNLIGINTKITIDEVVVASDKIKSLIPYSLGLGLFASIICEALRFTIENLLAFFLFFMVFEGVTFIVLKVLKKETRSFVKRALEYLFFYLVLLAGVIVGLFIELRLGEGLIVESLIQLFISAPMLIFVADSTFKLFESLGKINEAFLKPRRWIQSFAQRLGDNKG